MEESKVLSLEEQLAVKLQQSVHHHDKTSKYISGYLDNIEDFKSVETILQNYGFKFSTRSSKSYPLLRRQYTACTESNPDEELKPELTGIEPSSSSTCSSQQGQVQEESIHSLHSDSKEIAGNCNKRKFDSNANKDMGVPFSMVKVIHKDCKYGRPYWKNSKEIKQKDSYEQGEAGCSSDHGRYIKKKRRTRNSMKKDCRATMIIREVQVYPEYAVEEQKTNWRKRMAKATTLERLRQDFDSDAEPKSFTRFWINVPLAESHSDHPLEGTNGTDISSESFVCTVENGVIETSEVYMDIECDTNIGCSEWSDSNEPCTNNDKVQEDVVPVKVLEEVITAEEFQSKDHEIHESVLENPIHESLDRIKGLLVVVNNVAEHCEDSNLLNEVEGDLKKILERFQMQGDPL